MLHVFGHTFHFPAQLVGGFTVSALVDKAWSQVSSFPPPGTPHSCRYLVWPFCIIYGPDTLRVSDQKSGITATACMHLPPNTSDVRSVRSTLSPRNAFDLRRLKYIKFSTSRVTSYRFMLFQASSGCGPSQKTPTSRKPLPSPLGRARGGQ